MRALYLSFTDTADPGGGSSSAGDAPIDRRRAVDADPPRRVFTLDGQPRTRGRYGRRAAR